MSTDAPAYEASGVNLAIGDATSALLGPLVASTHGPQVPRGLGLFGGLFDASALKEMRRPLLVSSIDGVGTKTRLAALRGRDALRAVGRDLVNHCVNDVAVQGARPLFFLDYLAFHRLESAVVVALVDGMAEACRAAGAALIGGETAEMPTVYRTDEYDAAGCLVGVVEADELIDGRRIGPGDLLFGLPSAGLHTNGYTLALSLLPQMRQGLDTAQSDALVDSLLAEHRSYLASITHLRARLAVHGLAHITGGGIPGNLVRILPGGVGAVVDRSTWAVPPLFRVLQRAGAIAEDEMYRVFNMGIGLIAAIPADSAKAARLAIPDGQVIGTVRALTNDGERVRLEGVAQ